MNVQVRVIYTLQEHTCKCMHRLRNACRGRGGVMYTQVWDCFLACTHTQGWLSTHVHVSLHTKWVVIKTTAALTNENQPKSPTDDFLWK